MEALKGESPFVVKTVYLDKNYYGSRSITAGTSIAEGAYGIILDQDDMLTKDALNIYSRHMDLYEDRQDFAGACGRCQRPDGSFIGTQLKSNAYYSNELAVRHLDKVRGEMLHCTRTSILDEYFRGMKPGYTNGWVWRRIAQRYNYVYTNEVVRIYDSFNLSSGTNLGLIRYVDARYEHLLDEMTNNVEYLWHDKAFLIGSLGQLLRLGLHLNLSFFDTARRLPRRVLPFLIAVYPAAFAKYVNDVRSKRVG